MFVLVRVFSYVACFMYISSIELDSSGNFLFLDFLLVFLFVSFRVITGVHPRSLIGGI